MKLSFLLPMLGLLVAVGVACGSSTPSPEPQTTPTATPTADSTVTTAATVSSTSELTPTPSPTTQPTAEPTAAASPAAEASSGDEPDISSEAPFIEASRQRPTSNATDAPSEAEQEFDIVTLLPFDTIPAILDPQFLTAEEAQDQYLPTELVLGLSINDDHRAYSVPFLSRHEIVDDVVGGVPVAVTW